MKIEIKKALLEGVNPEHIITEAKHAGTIYEKGTTLGNMNRSGLTQSIKIEKSNRDSERKIGDHEEANFHDNRARVLSQMSKPRGTPANLGYYGSRSAAATQQPRLYQAAKK